MVDELNKLMNEKTPLLIDFSSADCGPCRLLAGELEEVKKELKDKVNIRIVDVDQEKAATIQFGVMYQIKGTPSILLFKEGRLVWKHFGAKFKNDLIKEITPYIEESQITF